MPSGQVGGLLGGDISKRDNEFMPKAFHVMLLHMSASILDHQSPTSAPACDRDEPPQGGDAAWRLRAQAGQPGAGIAGNRPALFLVNQLIFWQSILTFNIAVAPFILKGHPMSPLLKVIKQQAKHQSDLVFGAWFMGFIAPSLLLVIIHYNERTLGYLQRLDLVIGLLILTAIFYISGLRIHQQLHSKSRLLAITAFALSTLMLCTVFLQARDAMLIIAPVAMFSMVALPWLAKRRVYQDEMDCLAQDASAYRLMQPKLH